MQYIEDRHYTYFETSDVSVCKRDDASLGHAPLEVTSRYYNNLNDDVFIVERQGFPIRIPSSGKRSNDIIVEVTRKFGPNVQIDEKNAFHHFSNESVESNAFIAAFENIDNLPINTNRTVSVRYRFSRDEIVEHGGVLYIAELDIILSVDQDVSGLSHPYSNASARYKLISTECDVNNTERFGYSMYIVSNDGKVSDKFTNIGGRVFRVPSTRNNSLRDGVYICSSGDSRKDVKHPMPTVKQYPLDINMEDIFLYDDPETAEKLGDRLAARDKELKELQLEHKEAEHKYKEAEHRFKMERIELDQAISDRKQEFDELKAELDRRYAHEEHTRRIEGMRSKDYYENRSAERRDSSDAFKYLPTLLTGAMAFFLAISKLKE